MSKADWGSLRLTQTKQHSGLETGKNKATHSTTQLLMTRFNIFSGHFDDIQVRFAQWSVPNKRAD